MIQNSLITASLADIDELYRVFLSESIAFEGFVTRVSNVVNQVLGYQNGGPIHVYKAFLDSLPLDESPPRTRALNATTLDFVQLRLPSENELIPNSEQLRDFFGYLYEWLNNALVRNGSRVEKKVLVIRNDITDILNQWNRKVLSWDECLREINKSVGTLSRSLQGFCIYKCFIRHHKGAKTNPRSNAESDSQRGAHEEEHAHLLGERSLIQVEQYEKIKNKDVVPDIQREIAQTEKQMNSRELGGNIDKKEFDDSLFLQNFLELMKKQTYSLEDLGRFAVRFVRTLTHLRPDRNGSIGNICVEEIKQILRQGDKNAVNEKKAKSAICSLVRDWGNLELDVLFRYYLISAWMKEENKKENEQLRKTKQALKEREHQLQRPKKRQKDLSHGLHSQGSDKHLVDESRGMIDLIPDMVHLQEEVHPKDEKKDTGNNETEVFTLEQDCVNMSLLHNRLQRSWSYHEINGTVSRATVSLIQAAISYHAKDLLSDMIRIKLYTRKQCIDMPTAFQVFSRNGKLKHGTAYYKWLTRKGDANDNKYHSARCELVKSGAAFFGKKFN
ncbi:hypothetical protein BWQ96_06984 [Gracilariopsis chorda]|uniref:Uncharacterized protein n=1 Tax=Gracilariopsis chorda TaxID=448386 RepID=A0A2V3IMH9_9FLOR|nr:hypothetical protein BWQ96_06984 [Gracilariopsis chorda]|eukprot:PXF43257.1 hypothetical protein BWQ96_06984 [Gracilariopsis chorda]